MPYGTVLTVQQVRQPSGMKEGMLPIKQENRNTPPPGELVQSECGSAGGEKEDNEGKGNDSRLLSSLVILPLGKHNAHKRQS